MNTAVGTSGLIRAFRPALSVEGLKPKTISDYVREAERLCKFLDGRPFEFITGTKVREHVVALEARLSAKTVQEVQLALRRFFQFLVREGEISTRLTIMVFLINKSDQR